MVVREHHVKLQHLFSLNRLFVMFQHNHVILKSGLQMLEYRQMVRNKRFGTFEQRSVLLDKVGAAKLPEIFLFVPNPDAALGDCGVEIRFCLQL